MFVTTPIEKIDCAPEDREFFQHSFVRYLYDRMFTQMANRDEIRSEQFTFSEMGSISNNHHIIVAQLFGFDRDTVDRVIHLHAAAPLIMVPLSPFGIRTLFENDDPNSAFTAAHYRLRTSVFVHAVTKHMLSHDGLLKKVPPRIVADEHNSFRFTALRYWRTE